MTTARPLRGAHGGARPPWATLLLTALVAGLYFWFGPAADALVFDRDGLAGGEPWRAVSGHLVHSDARHLGWNLTALMGLGTLYEAAGRREAARYLGLLLVGAAAIDLWLWWLVPELGRYCGLSGVLNALMAAVVLRYWRLTGSAVFPLIGLAAVAKILVEGASGAALFSTTDWQAVPEAHAAGILAGILWTLAVDRRDEVADPCPIARPAANLVTAAPAFNYLARASGIPRVNGPPLGPELELADATKVVKGPRRRRGSLAEQLMLPDQRCDLRFRAADRDDASRVGKDIPRGLSPSCRATRKTGPPFLILPKGS